MIEIVSSKHVCDFVWWNKILMHSPTQMEKAWKGLMISVQYVSYEFLKNLTASHSWLDTCACKYSLGISLKNPYPTIKKAVYRTWILWSFKWVYYVKHYTFNVLANSISFNNILRSLSCAYQPNAACRLNPGL